VPRCSALEARTKAFEEVQIVLNSAQVPLDPLGKILLDFTLHFLQLASAAANEAKPVPVAE